MQGRHSEAAQQYCQYYPTLTVNKQAKISESLANSFWINDNRSFLSIARLTLAVMVSILWTVHEWRVVTVTGHLDTI